MSLNFSTLPASPLLGFRPSSLQLTTSEASNDDSLEDGTEDYEICSAVLYLPLSRLYNCLYHCHIHCSLQTRLLQFSLLQPSEVSTRLQQTQNCVTRTVVKAPKYVTPIPALRSLHWLKITERIEHKLQTLTYKVLTTTQPPHLHDLISDQPSRRLHPLSPSAVGHLRYPACTLSLESTT